MGKFNGYMIGSDFDGTFCVDNEELMTKNIETIRYFRAEGGVFGIVTGRCYTNAVYDLAAEYKDTIDFVIAMNGTTASYPDGRLIFENHGDTKNLRPLYDMLMESDGISYLCCATKENYYYLGEREGQKPPEFFKDFYQVVARCTSHESAIALAESVRVKFGDSFNPLQNGCNVDIPPAGVTKATGVAAAAKHFGIPEENIFTVGDNYNDMDMIRAFFGCAVENAVDELKTAACLTVPCVAGIVEYIEKTRVL